MIALPWLGHQAKTQTFVSISSLNTHFLLIISILGHGGRKQNTELLNESLAAQKLNNDGKVKATWKARVKGPGKGKAKATVVISSDEDDGEYTNSEASNSSALDDESASEVDITNEEVSSVVYHNINKCALISLQLAGSLASKTIPSTSTAKDSKKRKCPHTRRQGSSKHQPVKKTKQPTAEHDATIDEDQDPPNERNSASASHSKSKPTVRCSCSCLGEIFAQNLQTGKYRKHNPIYLFYEVVPVDAQGNKGNKGDQHYKCYHGNWKVLTITWAMRSSLNGLILLLVFLSTTDFSYRAYQSP